MHVPCANNNNGRIGYLGYRIHSLTLIISWLYPLLIWVRNANDNSGAPSTSAKRSPIVIKERKGNPRVDFLSSWLAVLLVGAYARRLRRRGRARWQPYSKKQVDRARDMQPVLLWYWTSTLWTIDTYQIKVFADQQINSSSKSRALLKFTADQLLVCVLIAGLYQGRVPFLFTMQDPHLTRSLSYHIISGPGCSEAG